MGDKAAASKDGGKMDLKGIVSKVGPLVDKAGELCDKASPYVQQGYDKMLDLWEKAQPYKPQEWGPALFGLLLVFFGGRFLTTIAAVEAVRLIGFHHFTGHLNKLIINYRNGMIAAKKDQEESDAKESKSSQTQRVALVLLKTVDPQQVAEAIGGLYEILLAVVATLRFKFIASVTLGCSIGDIFAKAADHAAKGPLEKSLAPEFHKWIDPGIKYTCKGVGVLLAWMLQRVMSALHCSMRGAQIFIVSGQEAAVKLGFLEKPLIADDSKAFTLAVGLVASVGFLNQVSYGFGLPFPLSLLFFPVYLVEWILTVMVGTV